MNSRLVVLVGIAATAVASAQTPSLLPGSRIRADSSFTRAVAAGDLDEDGVLDLVTNGDFPPTAHGIVFLRGLGDGSFAPPVEFIGSSGQTIAIRDVTGDGHPDVIVAGEISEFSRDPLGFISTRHIWVHPGNGDGTCAPVIDSILSVGESGFIYDRLELADLDSDGDLDVAMLDPFVDCCVETAFGDGHGTFGGHQSLFVGQRSEGLAVDDFNHDGALDIAVTVDENFVAPTIVTLMGHGDGTFEGPVSSLVPDGYGDIDSTDLDGDAIPDVALLAVGFDPVNSWVGVLHVLRGLGHGDFALVATYPVPLGPIAVRFADVDADGLPDLVASIGDFYTTGTGSVINHGQLAVLKGLGGLAFGEAQSFLIGGHPFSVDVGDFNGDGHADVALGQDYGGFESSDLSIAFGNGDTTFATMKSVVLNSKPIDVAIGDLNQDGIDDVASSTSIGNFVALGLGDGTFAPSVKTQTGDVTRLAAADLNADHIPDLVYEVNDLPFNLTVALGIGDGVTFAPPTSYFSGFFGGPAVADVDGDGVLDVLGTFTSAGKLGVWRGNGDGTLAPYALYSTSGEPSGLLATPLDADAIADVAVANGGAQSVAIFRGSMTGTLSAPNVIPVNGTPELIAGGDIDKDGDTDLIVASAHSVQLSVLGNVGNGGFVVVSSIQLDQPCISLRVTDFDRDGAPDVVLLHAAPPSNELVVLKGSGTATFAPPAHFFTGTNPVNLAAADFNRDGFTDLAVVAQGDKEIRIELNGSDLWSDLGYALAGLSTIKPRLTGTGNPIPTQLVTLTATGVPAPSFGLLFVGLDTVMQPYQGGMLVPRIDTAVPMRPGFPLSGRWPKGLDAGTPVYFQAWFATPSTGGGAISATNALVTISQ